MTDRDANVSIVKGRLKILPRRHRIAHLRALIRHSSAVPFRRKQLIALLRDEVNASLLHDGCTR